ncbi:MAG TPA: biotin synthase BioB [Solirubrobacterales bacterium]|nr:biotin synthase BioB [Solirubrobacterales bacterium]
MSQLNAIAAAAIEGAPPSREDALALLRGEDEGLIDLVAAAGRVRRRFFGNRVRLNFLINMKSGACPEDCSYCSQRRGSEAEVLKYPWLQPEEMAELADVAAAAGARRVCLVAAGRCPNDRDMSRVEAGIGAIRERQPELEICTCLGLIEAEQAERLHDAGVVAYNHNLNTSEAHYGEVCSTHTYEDRVRTVRCAEGAGLSACSGAIFGMGESDEDVADVAFSLRELEPASVPVNFLIPFEGTPLEGEWRLTPQRCLRILALFRFVFPNTELRLGGGREIHLRTLQPLALEIANSIFVGDYLTSEGQAAAADRAMIADAGFVVDGLENAAVAGGPAWRQPVEARRRGAGTALAPNA